MIAGLIGRGPGTSIDDVNCVCKIKLIVCVTLQGHTCM